MGLIESLATLLAPILNLTPIRRTRRNHGLEHATIHVLTQTRRVRIAGRSDSHGFYLLGEVDTEDIERSAHDALRRMRAGQHELAIHPNCGTNLLTTGTMASLAALIGTAGSGEHWRLRLERFPTMLVMVIGALIVSPGLGLALQRHVTTHGDPGDLVIASIRRSEIRSPLGGTLVVHRVETSQG